MNAKLLWKSVLAAALAACCPALAQQPADNCIDAPELALGQTYNFTTDISAGAPGLDTPCTSSTFSEKDVWFKHTAVNTGDLIIETCGTGFGNDVVIAAYNGCGGAFLKCDGNVPFNSSCERQRRLRVHVTMGQPVWVRLATAGFLSGEGVLTLHEAPSNPLLPTDSCGSAPELSLNTPYEFSTVGATHDTVTVCNPTSIGEDVWFKHTAVNTGLMTIKLCGTRSFTISAFDGCGGTLIACGETYGLFDPDCQLINLLKIPVVAGQMIRVRLANDVLQSPPGEGIVTLSEATSVEPNDTCEHATALTLNTPAVASLANATPGNPPHGCSTFGAFFAPDVWFKYAHGNRPSGFIIAKVCGIAGDYGLPLVALDGCDGDTLACTDRAACPQSLIMPVNTGQTIYFCLTAYGPDGFFGAGTIEIREIIPPANDTCEGATPLVLNTPTAVDMTNATSQGIASSCGLASSPDVWFKYSRGNNPGGVITVNECGTGYNSGHTIYDGCGGNEITCLSEWSSNIFPDEQCPVGGHQYHLAVSTNQTIYFRIIFPTGSTGTGTITVSEFTSPAANDVCANAEELHANVPKPFDTSNASPDIESRCGTENTGPTVSIGPSVWFKYMPSTTGVVEVLAIGATYYLDLPSVVLFDGCGGGDITCVRSTTVFAPGDVHAEARAFAEVTRNVPLLIQVQSAPGDSDQGTLRVIAPEPPCPADFNGDSVRDVADLFGYINAWLAKTPSADFNHDTHVDVADLFGFINAWLAGC